MLGCVASSVLVPSVATAQKARAKTVRSASVGADYRLAPDDVISVSVLRHPELSAEEITVSSSGRIDLPEAGQILASGKTTTQLRDAIRRSLERTMVAPQVTVSLKTPRVQRVIVLGAVAKSGPYDIKPGWRVSEALAAAGWTPGRADETVAKLARPSGQVVNVDLAAILKNPASAHNRRLGAGDVITLQSLEPKRVTVNGDVAKPDVYELRRARTVVDALNAAGGLKGRPSDSRGFILRKGKRLELNLDDASEFRTSAANVVLQAGDLINVELAPKRVTVSGDVAKPESYELRRAPTLLDALNAAGGLKQEADQTRGFVLRGNQKIELNVEDAVQYRVAAANLKLQDGDLVSIDAVPRLRVTVSGPFARKPDNYELAPDAGVVQAIAQAGGPSVPYEQVVATVQRGRQILPVNLVRAVFDPDANLPLQNGDVILLNEAPEILRVSVTGQVKTPGALRLEAGTTVQKAIADAGGLAIKPEVASISILRNTARSASSTNPASTNPASTNEARQLVVKVDAVALYNRNDLSQNALLQDGDLVSVTEIQIPVVTIGGEVENQGPYNIKPGESLGELFARAGGQTDEAALTRVILRRGASEQTIDAYDAIRNGARSNIALEAGDFISVPRNTAKVTVMQAVQRPGNYILPERTPLTVVDALNLAGGPRDRAIFKEVVLVRPNPAAPNGLERQLIRVDEVAKGNGKSNVVLRDGDVIYVPEYRAKTSPLGILGQAVGAVLGLRAVAGG